MEYLLLCLPVFARLEAGSGDVECCFALETVTANMLLAIMRV